MGSRSRQFRRTLPKTPAAHVEPSPRAWNLWINFVLYEVMGAMSEADSLMREHGHDIRAVAAYMRFSRAVKLGTLYRGILIEPEHAPDGTVGHDPKLTFVSWTESLDAACFFASSETTISAEVARMRPGVQGFLIRDDDPVPSRMLFHHSWRRFRLPDVGPVDLAHLASLHPGIGGSPGQFEHYLETQAEVVMDPPPAGTRWELHSTAECPPARTLDERFTPPEFSHLIRNRRANAGRSVLDRSISTYGITDSWPSAGFILPDGRLLDFSEGGGYGRSQDHRNVAQFMSGKARRRADQGDRWEALEQFMRVTGAIRLMPEVPAFDVYTDPTREQIDMMVFVADTASKPPVLEMHRRGAERFYREYEEWNVRNLRRDIAEYWG